LHDTLGSTRNEIYFNIQLAQAVITELIIYIYFALKNIEIFREATPLAHVFTPLIYP
jgi:hypothetical protein